MELTTLARDAWRITRSQPTLWILHALLLVAGLPAMIVSANSFTKSLPNDMKENHAMMGTSMSPMPMKIFLMPSPRMVAARS